MRRSSIRMQLTGTMVAVAVIATATSMLIANRSLHDHLDSMVTLGSATSHERADSDALASELDRQHALAGGIASIFAIGVALLLGTRLSAPLRRLSDAADRLADGDLDATVPQGGPTEVRNLADDLDRLRQNLAHEDRLRRQGFAELAHELRTPVTNIRARLEAAQDGVIPIERGLPVMASEVERIGRLLDDLSLLADLENPTATHHVEPVDLTELVRRQASLAAGRASSHGLRLHMEGRPAAWVLGEPHRLEQVVCNLLSNAIAYSEPSGTITLDVAHHGDQASLAVLDEGIGIEAADLPYVTRRFWRGRTARQLVGDGSGVGLAVVEEIVRAHHGRLQLTSRPGCGTAVHVMLPRADVT